MGRVMTVYTVDATNAREQEVHRWFAEASELRFPPGFWPREIETTLGNGHPFVIGGEGEGGTRYYYQRIGCISLTVWND